MPRRDSITGFREISGLSSIFCLLCALIMSSICLSQDVFDVHLILRLEEVELNLHRLQFIEIQFSSCFSKPKAKWIIDVVILSQKYLHSIYVGWWCFFASHSGRPWEYFITMPGEGSTTINQMCWPVIIASALSRGSRDFTRELPLIGLWRTRPCVFWKTSEQKAECQFNWCVCVSRCTLPTSCKLVPGCNSRTKGLTHWYVHTTMISYCASNVWRTLSAAVKGNGCLVILC